MKRLMLLLPLLLLPIAGWGQTPKKTHVVGDCFAAANDATAILSQQTKAPDFELYVICNASDWETVMVRNDLRPSETALTDWANNRMWLGPKSFTDPLHLKEVIAHELEHLRCHCDLGERNPHHS